MRLFFKYMPSPVGVLRLVAHDQALVAVLWENENPKRVRLAAVSYTHLTLPTKA